MLELYHHGTSACAAKVRLALAEKQLQWTSHYVDILAGEQFSPEYLKINAHAVVPTLVHEGRVVCESTVICEYLEDAFAQHRLYPEDPYERAQVRLWTKAVDEELHPACSTLTYVASHRYTLLRNGIGSFDEFLKQGAREGRAARERKWRWVQEGISAPGVGEQIRLYDAYLQRMEQALQGRDWLVGSAFTMADVAMVPYLNRLAALSMEDGWTRDRYPRVADWFHRVRARPTFTPALVDWVPTALRDQMAENGRKAWPELRAMLFDETRTPAG